MEGKSTIFSVLIYTYSEFELSNVRKTSDLPFIGYPKKNISKRVKYQGTLE